MSSALARCRCRSSALSAFCDDDHRKHLCDAYSLVDGAFFLRYYYSIVSHFMKKQERKRLIFEIAFWSTSFADVSNQNVLFCQAELLLKLFQKIVIY